MCFFIQFMILFFVSKAIYKRGMIIMSRYYIFKNFIKKDAL